MVLAWTAGQPRGNPLKPRSGSDGFVCGLPQARQIVRMSEAGSPEKVFRSWATMGHEPLTANRCCHEGRTSPSMVCRLRCFGARRHGPKRMQPPGCHPPRPFHESDVSARFGGAVAERLHATGRRWEKSRRRLFLRGVHFLRAREGPPLRATEDRSGTGSAARRLPASGSRAACWAAPISAPDARAAGESPRSGGRRRAASKG